VIKWPASDSIFLYLDPQEANGHTRKCDRGVVLP